MVKCWYNILVRGETLKILIRALCFVAMQWNYAQIAKTNCILSRQLTLKIHMNESVNEWMNENLNEWMWTKYFYGNGFQISPNMIRIDSIEVWMNEWMNECGWNHLSEWF